MFLFIFLLPALQAIIFCLAIGHDPTLLKMAIVNDELDPSQGRICNYTTDCTYSMFSCRYLRFLDNQTIIQVGNFYANSRSQSSCELHYHFSRFHLKLFPTPWKQREWAKCGAWFISVKILPTRLWLGKRTELRQTMKLLLLVRLASKWTTQVSFRVTILLAAL